MKYIGKYLSGEILLTRECRYQCARYASGTTFIAYAQSQNIGKSYNLKVPVQDSQN